MNELCKLKGHMWTSIGRVEKKREDEIYSICIKKECIRCGKITDKIVKNI